MKYITLGEVSEFINGYAFKPSNWENDGLKIIRIQNLTDQDKVFNRTTKVVPEKYIVHKGDLLISWSATLGIFEWKSDEDALLNQHIFKAVLDSNVIEKKYFMYVLKFTIAKMSQFTHGSTMKHIVRGDFLKHKIPLPSLEEQKRIIKILDQANELRQKRKNSLNLLDEYVKSAFLNIFGDPVTNSKNWKRYGGNKYSEEITVGVVIKPASYYVENGIPALRSQNITKDGITTNNLVFFSQKDNETKLSKSIIRRNNVLIVRTGQPGTAAIVPKELDGANCIDAIIVKLNKKIITPEYLVTFFNSAGGKEIVLKTARGQIQQHFNIGSLNNAQIPIPPIELQQQFSKVFKEKKLLKQKMLDQSVELENQFQAVMQKSFNSSI